MTILKCKMCGGDLSFPENASIAECQYCGSEQTIPKADDERKLTLFARANRLRIACQFDKASSVYETIVADFPEEAEAYWGLVLCKYGIEYVDDPKTGRKIPTCHRSSFERVIDDSDFQQALENADTIARRVYREEAKRMEEIRKGIIAVSAKEEPYDIFICYKETTETGDRTLDSVLAQDVYDALTDKGYRVFFSRISLEEKLGKEYEPYIFAALNSAKIMLAFGTDYEHFNAVWVKNEWSRFLKLMEKDKERYLIPCYKGIDAYDMPEEFTKLQAQDMGKVGAIQDLLRGIGKILLSQSDVVIAPKAAGNANAMVLRGQFALEDRDWKKAEEYFERALDENPEDGQAHIGKVLAELQISTVEQLGDCFLKLKEDKNFERAIRFSTGADKEKLERIKETVDRKWYVKSLTVLLEEIKQDLIERKKEEQAEIARLNRIYNRGKNLASSNRLPDVKEAVSVFASISGCLDADTQREMCLEKIKKIEQARIAQLEKERMLAEKKVAEEKKACAIQRKHNNKLLFAWLIFLGAMIVASTITLTFDPTFSDDNLLIMVIASFLVAVMFAALFSGATVAATFLAILFAGKKSMGRKTLFALAYIFSALGIFLLGFFATVAICDWTVESSDVLLIFNTLIHLGSLVVLLLTKKA